MFGAAKLIDNADHDKYGYSGYGIWSNAGSEFLWPDSELGKNVIFGADRKKILVFGESPIYVLDDSRITLRLNILIIF